IRAIKVEPSRAAAPTIGVPAPPRNRVTRAAPSPRSSGLTPRNPRRSVPTTGHARNQDGATASAQVAPRGATPVGRRSQGRRAETRRPSLDAPRHAADGRSAIPGAGHHSRDTGAAVAPLPPAVRGAPPRHRAGVGRPVPGDSLLDPAGPRPLHRRGGRGPARPRGDAPP